MIRTNFNEVLNYSSFNVINAHQICYVLWYYYITYLEGLNNRRIKIENLIAVSPNQNSSQVHPEYLSDAE
jgi:hypothetical protein